MSKAHKPSWFRPESILSINARTCGLNKDGLEQFVVDPVTGQRSTEIDDELERLTCAAVAGHEQLEGIARIASNEIKQCGIWVPTYFDPSSENALYAEFKDDSNFEIQTVGDLEAIGLINLFSGHGSPSQDQRIGDIPYIKVSDLRAGLVNVNPTNMVPLALAKTYWKGESSGLQAYDLLSPERASKNIGEFSVLLPGQEQLVLTNEIIGVRSTQRSFLDQFSLMWAFSLRSVRSQWRRVVLMQTNREDVGDRWLEIKLPVPTNRQTHEEVSNPFKTFYEMLDHAKAGLRRDLVRLGHAHHLFYESRWLRAL